MSETTCYFSFLRKQTNEQELETGYYGRAITALYLVLPQILALVRIMFFQLRWRNDGGGFFFKLKFAIEERAYYKCCRAAEEIVWIVPR